MLETICETLVDAYKRNWITSRDGNVSIRHHDRDHFYITPSGVRKQTLQPDQFKKIKLLESSWEELEYTDISRSLKPSGEIPLHYGLQKKMGQHSNEVRVVVHLHPTYCIAAMHAGIDLSTISESFPELNRYTRAPDGASKRTNFVSTRQTVLAGPRQKARTAMAWISLPCLWFTGRASKGVRRACSTLTGQGVRGSL